MTNEEAITILKYNSNVIHQTIDGRTDPKEVEALDMAIKALEQESRWILVSERLPESNGVYIVTKEINDGFECRDLTDACYFDGTTTWYDNHGREYLNKKIKAWIPLPEPYKTESGE